MTQEEKELEKIRENNLDYCKKEAAAAKTEERKEYWEKRAQLIKMPWEERKKYAEDNAKITYDFLAERGKEAFKKEMPFENFNNDFVRIFTNNVLDNNYFLRYFGGMFIYELKCFDKSIWSEIREGAIKFTTLPK